MISKTTIIVLCHYINNKDELKQHGGELFTYMLLIQWRINSHQSPGYNVASLCRSECSGQWSPLAASRGQRSGCMKQGEHRL